MTEIERQPREHTVPCPMHGSRHPMLTWNLTGFCDQHAIGHRLTQGWRPNMTLCQRSRNDLMSGEKLVATIEEVTCATCRSRYDYAVAEAQRTGLMQP